MMISFKSKINAVLCLIVILSTDVYPEVNEYIFEYVGDELVPFVSTTDIENPTYYSHKIAACLANMPEQHRQYVVPIYFVKRLPGGRETGAGYFPNNNASASLRTWLGRENVTGIPDDIIQEDIDRGVSGIIAITASRLIPTGPFRFSALHETAHSIQESGLNLSDPNLPYTELSQQYPGTSKKEHDTEAYSRYIVKPARICRNDRMLPEDRNMHFKCTRRVADILRSGQAFASVPDSWEPERGCGRAGGGSQQTQRVPVPRQQPEPDNPQSEEVTEVNETQEELIDQFQQCDSISNKIEEINRILWTYEQVVSETQLSENNPTGVLEEVKRRLRESGGLTQDTNIDGGGIDYNTCEVIIHETNIANSLIRKGFDPDSELFGALLRQKVNGLQVHESVHSRDCRAYYENVPDGPNFREYINHPLHIIDSELRAYEAERDWYEQQADLSNCSVHIPRQHVVSENPNQDRTDEPEVLNDVHREEQSIPEFLFFNPHESELELQIEDLNNQIERAERLARTNRNMAVDEGSREYVRDPLTQKERIYSLLEKLAIAFGGGPGDGVPGMTGQETVNRLRSVRELEQNVERYENEARELRRQRTLYEQELYRIRQRQ